MHFESFTICQKRQQLDLTIKVAAKPGYPALNETPGVENNIFQIKLEIIQAIHTALVGAEAEAGAEAKFTNLEVAYFDAPALNSDQQATIHLRCSNIPEDKLALVQQTIATAIGTLNKSFTILEHEIKTRSPDSMRHTAQL